MCVFVCVYCWNAVLHTKNPYMFATVAVSMPMSIAVAVVWNRYDHIWKRFCPDLSAASPTLWMWTQSACKLCCELRSYVKRRICVATATAVLDMFFCVFCLKSVCKNIAYKPKVTECGTLATIMYFVAIVPHSQTSSHIALYMYFPYTKIKSRSKVKKCDLSFYTLFCVVCNFRFVKMDIPYSQDDSDREG